MPNGVSPVDHDFNTLGMSHVANLPDWEYMSCNIDDMTDLYVQLVEENINKINGMIFNAGWDNLKVNEIARLVKECVGNVEIEVVPTDDIRSYHVSSAKIKDELGFETKKSVKDAINDLKLAFKEGKIKDVDNEKYYNVKLMKDMLGV